MKRRSLGRQARAPSAYHRKKKRPYVYPSWVETGRDLPPEIAALVQRNLGRRHGVDHDSV